MDVQVGCAVVSIISILLEKRRKLGKRRSCVSSRLPVVDVNQTVVNQGLVILF